MRREQLFRMLESEAVELLARSPTVQVATLGEEGQPILRTLHHVVVEGRLCFHSAPSGEKVEAMGRRAVASTEEVVASIPSYFLDAQRACPATTLYRSVQVHGTLEEIEEPTFKARVLAGLMAKLQPEGGHVPITADHPLYRGPVNGLLVYQLVPSRIDGKAKLGQNRSAPDRLRMLEALWRRGAPGDANAVERILAANPDTPVPGFLQGPPGLRLHCQLEESGMTEALALIASEYWNQGVCEQRLIQAIRGSTAWVGVRDAEGRLVAHARALSDGAKHAWVYDVVTAAQWRGKGVAKALLRMLLDHPAVRGASKVLLGTRDAQPLYRQLGFISVSEAPKRPYESETMVLLR
ncbi:MAG: GNAT family N-acetyltransferase [Myxococcota bacterium]|nr:GNAT family N-acetyltransferase [Myxococcota bacterium]